MVSQSDAPDAQRSWPLSLILSRVASHWTQHTTPRWFGPAMAMLTLLVGLLTLLIDDGERTAFSAASGSVALSMIVLALLIETARLGWSRALFTALVSGSVALLLVLGHWAVAPIFLLMLVTWVVYVGTRRQGLIALVLALLALLPMPLIWRNPPGDWFPWVMGICYSAVAAHALATQQRLLVALRAAQADLARQSAAEERRRIAREVHDVIAHSLAVTMLHLTGARHILLRDPEGAAAALAQAEQLGRQSLADIRRTVGLLGQTSAPATPLPGIQDISTLVDDFTRAGLAVRCAIEGDSGRISAAIGLDIYRIVQEALANVAKHAPGAPVELALRFAVNETTLRVWNGGSASGAHPLAAAASSGLGLAGMRERATLLGGSFVAGPHDAGWLVTCAIPVETALAMVS